MADLNQSIRIFLEQMNVDPKLVEPKNWDHLAKIEKVFNELFLIQTENNNVIKSNRPSINNIAVKSKIARQTIYNNELLKKYIEFRIDQYDESDPLKKNDQLRDKILHLEKQIRAMVVRDVNLELMRRKITLLENEIKLIKQEKDEIQIRYNNLKQKADNIQTLEKKAEVLPFNNKQ
ncbi:hypothetical protein [Sporolactobacillus pectinivorans]|uniref:hypothetical protein n=1 Tax=Sporolactobacillus pectinivorans TaxID=1591408 RepID=UPI000C2662C9|nr:hypothetical protein [Sporolactobacillus pectinivorans]